MAKTKIERSHRGKPITGDEVPEGHLVFQIMFKHAGQLYAFDAMGDTVGFITDEELQMRVLWNLWAAAVSNAGAVHGLTVQGADSLDL